MSTLPGTIVKLNIVISESKCDKHGDRQATHRLTSESDSFGDEYIYMCDECYREHTSIEQKPDIGLCEWCHTEDVVLKPTRDYDEGLNGPVYYVCSNCRRKQREQAQEEYDRFCHDDD